MTSFFKQLSAPPGTGLMNKPQWKYGFLAIVLFLLAFQIWSLAFFSPPLRGNRYDGLLVCTALLLNHVAFWFWFGPRTAVILRLVALVFAFVSLGSFFFSMK